MLEDQYMLLVMFGLSGIVTYSMYRYFNDLVEEYKNNTNRSLKAAEEFWKERFESHYQQTSKRTEVLEHRLREGIQNNSTCCKMATEKLRNEIAQQKSKKQPVTVTVPPVTIPKDKNG